MDTTISRTTLSEMTTEQLQLAIKLAQVLLELPKVSAPPEPRSTCPHCKRNMEIKAMFGYRVVHGTTYPQSWCRDCRNKPRGKR